MVCETRDWEHSKELRKFLLDTYSNVVFSDPPLAIIGSDKSDFSNEKSS